MKERLEIVQGDITRQRVDAIVNAANSSLLGGGGVDGAIHRAVGPGLREECRGLGGCPPGEARITRGHDLPARFVIHTVGPIWRGGEHGEAAVLAGCYRSAFALAAEHGVTTLAFPSIGTGAFGYPVAEACRIAVREIRSGLERHAAIRTVTVVCFDPGTLRAYRDSLEGSSR